MVQQRVGGEGKDLPLLTAVVVTCFLVNIMKKCGNLELSVVYRATSFSVENKIHDTNDTKRQQCETDSKLKK